MALKSLNRLGSVRAAAMWARHAWLKLRIGMVLGDRSTVSLSSQITSRRRGMVVVGPESQIAFKTLIFTYDHRSKRDLPIHIGARCFIGGGSVITPGVTIGDESIVGAGAIVLEDVPPRCIVGGNPARILRKDIEVGPFGRMKVANLVTEGWREL
jgi:maltose O-acetyltransferase